jgi:hypothetical protein
VTQNRPFTVHDVELDVGAAVPVDERCVVTASLFLPDEPPERATEVVGVP